MKKNISNIVLVTIILFALITWQCPIEKITGIPCPGCMMTTAFYYLVQFDLKTAFYFNPVIYLLVIMAFPLWISYKKNKKIFQYLLAFTLFIWLGIYCIRMLTIFPNFPMQYVEDNLIAKIINLFK